MFKKILTVAVVSFVFAAQLMSDGTTKVIKVSGTFAIINKGRNQGIQEGQIYLVKRQIPQGLLEICQVKVFRTTANRAAVEQVRRAKTSLLQKGDKLFSNRELSAAMQQKSGAPKRSNRLNRNFVQKASLTKPKQPTTIAKQSPKQDVKPEPIVRSSANTIETKNVTSALSLRSYADNLKKPWITFQAGVIIPNGDLAVVYSPSITFGGSYIVEALAGFNLGIELNNTFFSAPFASGNVAGAINTSSSLLEAHVVLQRFFGRNFFVEGGGGIYRPKISTTSIDNFKTTVSSTNFGLFGGTGVFVPTSEYAGIMLRGRLYSYFDQTQKKYFGVSGGFRFKIR